MNPFVLLGVVGVVLVVVGMRLRSDVLDNFSAVIIGTFAGVLGWVGFILQSLMFPVPAALLVGLVIAGGATWFVQHNKDFLSH